MHEYTKVVFRVNRAPLWILANGVCAEILALTGSDESGQTEIRRLP